MPFRISTGFSQNPDGREGVADVADRNRPGGLQLGNRVVNGRNLLIGQAAVRTASNGEQRLHPADECRCRRHPIAHPRELEMRVRVDETWKNRDVAEIFHCRLRQ